MAKLGSIKHPAVVRVQTEAKAFEMMKTCKEHGWMVIVGIEPDKYEDISDVQRLLDRSTAASADTENIKQEQSQVAMIPDHAATV